jgi:hypothetical protein
VAECSGIFVESNLIEMPTSKSYALRSREKTGPEKNPPVRN